MKHTPGPWQISVVVLSLALPVFTACAKPSNDAKANPSPSPVSVSHGQSICRDNPACVQFCFNAYPYQDPQAIASDYNSRGLLYSGAYQAAISNNEKIKASYDACTAQAI